MPIAKRQDAALARPPKRADKRTSGSDAPRGAPLQRRETVDWDICLMLLDLLWWIRG